MTSAFSSFYAPNQTARPAGWRPNRVQVAQEEFEAAHPGLKEFLASAASWSSFAASLGQALDRYGYLTDKQVAAATKMRATTEARPAKARGVEVDLTAVRQMFETAVKNGKKKPIYRAAGLVLNRAPDSGKNPGALYVKDAETEEYLGKILGTVYSGKPAPGLTEIAADPYSAAVEYGKATGRCSVCGAELTNDESIKLGIGPICRAKWGW